MTSYPLIIIGMHRSGTSMLARLLREAGLFLGWRTQPDHDEARFFQGLNNWAMRQATADWDAPGRVDDLLANPTAFMAATEYLELSAGSPRSIEFLGPARYLRSRRIVNLSEPWGFKDPRSTFTLPLWLEVFPDARVLHVTRHGVDVAESLRVREQAFIAKRVDSYAAKRRRYRVIAARALLSKGLSVLDVERGLGLWDAYVTRSSEHVHSLGERALEFRYEDFLQSPHDLSERLLDFCGLAVPPSASAWLDSVDPSRAFAFTQQPELVALASREQSVLARHGYAPTAG
jgi:hypothetical protein